VPTLAIYAVLALVATGAIGGGIWKVNSSGYKRGVAECKAEWEAANAAKLAEDAKKIDAASSKVEKGNAKAKVVYRTITQTVDRYIDRPVYRNICFDVDGLRDANAALRGEISDTSKSDRAVPRPNSVK